MKSMKTLMRQAVARLRQLASEEDEDGTVASADRSRGALAVA